MSSESTTGAVKEEATSLLVPKLRFPEFRGEQGWKKTQIGDLNPFVTSGSRGWAQFYSEIGELFIRITNLRRDFITVDLMDSTFVSLPAGESEGVRTKLKENDVLISITADIGIIGYVDSSVPSPAYINQHIALVRFENEQICSKFVAYFLASERAQRHFLLSTDRGTKAGISLIGIQKIALILPALPEQKKIADCLTSLDNLIAAQAQKVDALKAHKKGLMQQLFPREGESQPRLRFPEFQDAGEWVPEALENLTSAKISYGIVQAGPHVSDGMPYIKSTDLNSSLCLANLARTSDAIAQKYRRSEVLPGDIVFSLRGNIGVSQIVPETISAANLTQGTARIRTKESPSFYFYALQSPSVRNKVLSVGKGSTFQEISLQALRNIQLAHPDPAEQQRIASCLSNLDSLITAESQQLEALKTHKKGLMQQLFPSSGEVET